MSLENQNPSSFKWPPVAGVRGARGLPSRLGRAVLVLLVALLLLPVLAVVGSWLSWDASALSIWRELAGTVLPGYVATTLWLCLWVALGTVLVGAGTAVLVGLFDFPGRRWFEWLLLLPLAMPAYVVAYGYTDFFQFSGPLQTGLRAAFGPQGWLWPLGLQGRLLPEIRSVGGAAWVFSFALYPYVYLLVRTALTERGVHLMEAARMLGAPMGRRLWSVALPLTRPAMAAGLALALMETLADFGVSSYFGIQTFTTGIYKAWLSMDNRVAAAQLATLLLAVVALLLWLESRAQARMRFATSRGAAGRPVGAPLQLRGRSAALAVLACSLPVLAGFVAPVLFMLRPLFSDWETLPWSRFVQWTFNSVSLGAGTALLAVALAAALAFASRTQASRLTRGVVQLAGLGYAVPGAVIVVGLLLPLGWLQAVAPASGAGVWLTATVAGLIWAYLVRFCAVALQSVQSGYARMPITLDDSARMLGRSGWTLWSAVHAPLLKRSLTAAGLLVFVDVMKELPATLVLRPFNTDTLAVVAYQMARDERLGEAALPSLALVLAGLIPVVLLSRTLRVR